MSNLKRGSKAFNPKSPSGPRLGTRPNDLSPVERALARGWQRDGDVYDTYLAPSGPQRHSADLPCSRLANEELLRRHEIPIDSVTGGQLYAWSRECKTGRKKTRHWVWFRRVAAGRILAVYVRDGIGKFARPIADQQS